MGPPLLGVGIALAKATEGIDVADTILNYAADTSAELIAMGAYGHSRLTGVRSLLDHARHADFHDGADADVALMAARS
jgi:hypothetical protein